MKIDILAIGKLKSRPVQELVGDYSRRLSHYVGIEIHACRDQKQAQARIGAHDFLVVLDERGTQLTSEGLADFIAAHQNKGTKRMAFYIGGPEGVGQEVKDRADFRLSLSQMTFPHEMIQAILLEQLYRACSILKGEPYHK